MHNIKNWESWAKNNLDELEFLRQENALLKENISELENTRFLNCKSNPNFSVFVSLYIMLALLMFIIPNFYSEFLTASTLTRFIIWFFLPILSFVLFVAPFSLIDSIKKSDSNNEKEHQTFNKRNIIFMIFHILISIAIAFWGPQ